MLVELLMPLAFAPGLVRVPLQHEVVLASPSGAPLHSVLGGDGKVLAYERLPCIHIIFLRYPCTITFGRLRIDPCGAIISMTRLIY